MARSFNSTTDSIIATPADAPASNWTVALRFKLNLATVQSYGTIVGFKGSGSYALFVGTSGTGPKLAVYSEGGNNIDPTPTSITSDVWYHLAIVIDATPNFQTYLNGATEGGALGYVPANQPTNLNLGLQSAAGSINGGAVAEVGYWNAPLTADEVTTLAKGYSPMLIRPASLLGYWPLIGRTSPEAELINGNGGTLTGTSAAPHPRIIMPTRAGKRPWIPAETVSI